MRVDLQRTIGGLPMNEKMDQAVDELMGISMRDDSPIFISDLLVDIQTANTAEPILGVLRGQMEKKYILRCKIDEWGKTLKPGDKVRRRWKKPGKIRDKHITPMQQNVWKRQGTYEKNMFTDVYYELDDRGCITITAHDMEYFLSNWGVHSVSGYPISYHPESLSTEPADVVIDGKKQSYKKHVHYYRCEEIEKENYEDLPILKSPKPKSSKQSSTKPNTKE